MSLVVRATEPAASPTPYTVPPSGKFDGADGSWSTFKVSVGSPGQDFRVIPSTKAGVTYVIAPEGCLAGVDPANCPQLRGIDIFNSAQNIGFQANASSTWSAIGQFEVDLEQALNYTGRGLFGTDVVSLGAAADHSSSLSLTGSVVSAIADPDYYLGMLGLGQVKSSFNSGSQPIDSTLYQLRASEKIPSFSYAYTAGAKYRLKSVLGSLILGGYDATRFDNTNNLTFTFSQDSSRLLTVSVDSIMATNTLQGTYSLTAGSHFSVIDSTVPHLWLPQSVCAEFETAFGLTYDPKTDLYLVNDTIHQQLLSKNPTLTFKLANSPNGATQNYTNIQLPYAAFDLQASYPFYQNATNYFPIRRAANESQYVLGRTLLQEAYLIVDYERSNFTLAQTVFPDPLPPAQVVTIVSPSESPATQSSSSGLSTGAIVGIAIGVVAAILIAALAFFLMFRRKRRANQQSQSNQQYELAGKNVSEVDSGNNASTAALPLKAPTPQELSGTPLTELASPANEHSFGHAYPQDQKTVIQVTDEPQELHGDSMVPITPKWCEVQMPQASYQRDADGESSSSRAVSTMLSDETHTARDHNTQAAVSPLTPRVPQYRY